MVVLETVATIVMVGQGSNRHTGYANPRLTGPRIAVKWLAKAVNGG